MKEYTLGYQGSSYKVVASSKEEAINKLIERLSPPDDEELTVSFGIQNGAAAAKTMTLDYIIAAVER